MPNEQEQDLFALTQGFPQAPLFNQDAVAQGGYGRPDPGSGIRINGNRPSCFPTIQSTDGAVGRIRPSYRAVDTPIRGRIPAPVSQPEEQQNMEEPRPPERINPFSTGHIGSMEKTAPIAPSIRHALAGRQGTLPLVYNNYQELLRSLTGRWVIADFLIGSVIQRRSGIIAHVGTGYLVLRDPCTQAQTGCDLNALRFLTVLPEGTKPQDSGCNLHKFDRL